MAMVKYGNVPQNYGVEKTERGINLDCDYYLLYYQIDCPVVVEVGWSLLCEVVKGIASIECVHTNYATVLSQYP